MTRVAVLSRRKIASSSSVQLITQFIRASSWQKAAVVDVGTARGSLGTRACSTAAEIRAKIWGVKSGGEVSYPSSLPILN